MERQSYLLEETEVERLHEILAEDLTRMDRSLVKPQISPFDLCPQLVIVDDFHVVAMAIVPNKTDSPLIVD